MTDLIKSYEWFYILEILRRSNGLEILDKSFSYLYDETRKYELGLGVYPQVEYAISLAQDQLRKQVSPSDSSLDSPPDSPRTQKRKVKESWIARFAPPPPPPSEPVIEPVKRRRGRPRKM